MCISSSSCMGPKHQIITSHTPFSYFSATTASFSSLLISHYISSQLLVDLLVNLFITVIPISLTGLVPTCFSIGCIASYLSWTTLSCYIQNCINLSHYLQNWGNFCFDIISSVSAFCPPTEIRSTNPTTFFLLSSTRCLLTQEKPCCFPKSFKSLPMTL